MSPEAEIQVNRDSHRPPEEKYSGVRAMKGTMNVNLNIM